jgi:hypothetical protein
MVPPELNAPIGEQKPLTALAVCAMFERAGGESEDRPSSWGKDSAPESSGDPFLIGIIASTPDLTHTVHPFFRPVFAGLRARLLTAGCDVLVSSRSPLVEPEGDPFSLDRWRRRGVDGLVAMGLSSSEVEIGPLLESGLAVVFVDLAALGRMSRSS